MKRIFFILLILCSFNSLSAQNTFFSHYRSSENRIIYRSIETINHNYILCGSSSIGSKTEPCSFLLKLDHEGSALQEETYNRSCGSVFCILQKSAINPDEFLITESLYSSPRNSMKIYRVNDDLQFNLFKEFQFTDSLETTVQYSINLGDSIFFMALYKSSENLSNLSLLKLNMIDSTNSSFIPVSTQYRIPSGLIYDTLNQKIKLAYSYSALAKDTFHHISTFDTDLNLIASCNPYPDFISEMRIQPMDQSYYLISGAIEKPFIKSEKLNAFKVDLATNEIVDSIQLNYGSDTITYPGGGKNMLVTDSCIWIVGMYNIVIITHPWSYEPGWVQVSKLTKNFELISQHYYGGDGAYTPFDIIETSDHGILISGGYFNPNAVPSRRKMDPFVIKTNSDGIVVNAENHDLPVAQEAIVFPNPGNEYLQVKLAAQINKAHIRIFDRAGKLLISSPVDISSGMVSTVRLKSGTYIYKIFSDNRLIGSGKWVKMP